MGFLSNLASAIGAFVWTRLEPMIVKELDGLRADFKIEMDEARKAIMADWDETTDQFMASFDTSTKETIERLVPDVNTLAEQIVSKFPNFGNIFGGH